MLHCAVLRVLALHNSYHYHWRAVLCRCRQGMCGCKGTYAVLWCSVLCHSVRVDMEIATLCCAVQVPPGHVWTQGDIC
jgi:hypothetical protein